MRTAQCYVLILPETRRELFEWQLRIEGPNFAEPVDDFDHSRNLPLICFVQSHDGQITHLAKGKKGNLAGTEVRRLNLDEITALSQPIDNAIIIDAAPKKFSSRLEPFLFGGGLVPPKSSQALIDTMLKVSPESELILRRYSSERQARIAQLSPRTRMVLAEQKEAVATALSVAGLNRQELQGWDYKEDSIPTSFLDGLESVRLREDTMVLHDEMNIPGYEILRKTPHGVTSFENAGIRLKVILANRLPLESTLGADLIYYNETFPCFLMVQYKAMDRGNAVEEDEDASADGFSDIDIEAFFRFPDKQLTIEINRMDSILAELKKCDTNDVADGFRLNENPFFLKLCPRLVFNPDNIGLVPGMYLPLDYWKLLAESPATLGSKGGRILTFKNVHRYLDNTSFISMASGAWVGTTIKQSKVLEPLIRSTLESGRAVVFAIKSDKQANIEELGGKS